MATLIPAGPDAVAAMTPSSYVTPETLREVIRPSAKPYIWPAATRSSPSVRGAPSPTPSSSKAIPVTSTPGCCKGRSR